MSFTFLIFYIIFNYSGYGIICDINNSCSDVIACIDSDICEISCCMYFCMYMSFVIYCYNVIYTENIDNEGCAGKSIIVNNVDIVNITCLVYCVLYYICCVARNIII